MSLSAEMLQQVHQLVVADTDLQARLPGAKDVSQAADMIVAAAAQKGLQVDASELAARLDAGIKAQVGSSLSDEQLKTVAGGIVIEVLIAGIIAGISGIVTGAIVVGGAASAINRRSN